LPRINLANGSAGGLTPAKVLQAQPRGARKPARQLEAGSFPAEGGRPTAAARSHETFDSEHGSGITSIPVIERNRGGRNDAR